MTLDDDAVAHLNRDDAAIITTLLKEKVVDSSCAHLIKVGEKLGKVRENMGNPNFSLFFP